MFGLFDLAKDVVRIAVAPVSIAANIARVVVEPVADLAEEVATEVKDSVDSLLK